MWRFISAAQSCKVTLSSRSISFDDDYYNSENPVLKGFNKKDFVGGNIFLFKNNYLTLFHLFYHKYKLLVALRLHFSKFNRT